MFSSWLCRLLAASVASVIAPKVPRFSVGMSDYRRHFAAWATNDSKCRTHHGTSERARFCTCTRQVTNGREFGYAASALTYDSELSILVAVFVASGDAT